MGYKTTQAHRVVCVYEDLKVQGAYDFDTAGEADAFARGVNAGAAFVGGLTAYQHSDVSDGYAEGLTAAATKRVIERLGLEWGIEPAE